MKNNSLLLSCLFLVALVCLATALPVGNYKIRKLDEDAPYYPDAELRVIDDNTAVLHYCNDITFSTPRGPDNAIRFEVKSSTKIMCDGKRFEDKAINEFNRIYFWSQSPGQTVPFELNGKGKWPIIYLLKKD